MKTLPFPPLPPHDGNPDARERADIRHIQAILGHEDIKTTQIYTQVAIRALQQSHAATHPAEARSTIQAARTGS